MSSPHKPRSPHCEPQEAKESHKQDREDWHAKKPSQHGRGLHLVDQQQGAGTEQCDLTCIAGAPGNSQTLRNTFTSSSILRIPYVLYCLRTARVLGVSEKIMFKCTTRKQCFKNNQATRRRSVKSMSTRLAIAVRHGAVCKARFWTASSMMPISGS